MFIRSSSLSCLLLSFVTGCLPPMGTQREEGTPDGNPVTPDADNQQGFTARQLFDNNVFSIISAKCNSAACHGETAPVTNPNFVDATATEAYDRATTQPKLVGDYSSAAPILTKIAAGHKGVTYSPQDIGAIGKWLQKEVDERPPQRDLIREWSGCMTLDDFQASNMAQATGNEETNQGRCKTCHALGEYDHVASDQQAAFFQMLTTDRTWLGQYFAVDAMNTTVLVNQVNFDEVGNGLAPHTTHPRFDAQNGQGRVALRDFHARTLVHFNAKTCAPPRF
jgi:hypothetical protein